MYYSQEVSERIRKIAHQKGITIKEILDACELNINTISKKSESGMASFSLAKIADYLDCSVDYLLCRTENVALPESTKSVVNINEDSFDNILAELYRFLQTDFITEANDIYCVLEFLLDSIRNANVSIGNKIKSISNDYDNIELFLNYGKVTVKLIGMLTGYLDRFSNSNGNKSNLVQSSSETHAKMTSENSSLKTQKIGEYVRSTMRGLSEKKYVFPDSILLKLTSGAETKKLFGISTPFLKEINNKYPISEQTKDAKGYNRYWKEIFEFNGHQYLIVSQWTKSNEERIRSWLDNLVVTDDMLGNNLGSLM